MLEYLVFLLVVLPVLSAVALLCIKNEGPRKSVVIATGAVLAFCSLALFAGGSFQLRPQSMLGLDPDVLVTGLDFALLAVILGIAVKLKSPLLIALGLLQILPLGYFEYSFARHAAAGPSLAADNLSLIMVLLVGFVGSLVCVYGLGYMKEHEAHLGLKKTRQPRFFFFLVLFLGAMNGLVLSNSLAWVYFFWEATTVCSFALIGHDGTQEARANSVRALWMNMLGGVAFALALIAVYKASGTVLLSDLLAHPGGGASLALLAAFFLLCFAGFTKAAQLPFQSWLCGAMVAPTPVSALLHSSTMVKAGVYLILRLAPAYAGTSLSSLIALFGAFAFLTTAALAIGQSNAKKILAYSTIGNLGVIVACAGINTPASIAAGVMLLIFHAVSKALLFLCVGAIEQRIGSRDIEDMRGLIAVMPRAAALTVAGILTMLLPPFGVLLTKWMAIESAMASPLLVLILALGSALTVVFWTRWAGLLLSAPMPAAGLVAPGAAVQAASMRIPMTLLAYGAVLAGLASPLIYRSLAAPFVSLFYKGAAYDVSAGSFASGAGTFSVYPLFLLLGAGFFYALRLARRLPARSASAPYLCGEQTGDAAGNVFRGPLGPVAATPANLYLSAICGEEVLTRWINVIAMTMLAVMFGGIL
ncbi:MAG: NADH-quinone oxidoreductase subunit L [Desulfovibrionaceae bacterium]|nr:NADH-quinone oxidoreductase subunit L [Desulfovibrionaceae bacterium]MBF0514944.1 NADH-quinone oxidoreductase subunit L [Desulfovibrionaceae bacterium]